MNELALTIINDGEGYHGRCQIAHDAAGSPTSWTVQHLAGDWFRIARAGAQKYERQFGSPGASCFTVVDILGAALELAEYYAGHIKEH